MGQVESKIMGIGIDVIVVEWTSKTEQMRLRHWEHEMFTRILTRCEVEWILVMMSLEYPQLCGFNQPNFKIQFLESNACLQTNIRT